VILKISVVILSGAGPGKYNSINNTVMKILRKQKHNIVKCINSNKSSIYSIICSIETRVAIYSESIPFIPFTCNILHSQSKQHNHGAEHYLRGHTIVSQHSMEPEGSIPNSQELSTHFYPELDQSSPHYPIPPLQDQS
jgi:hypothetical protein